MNDVVKVLVEYNLPREVAERIDLEARRMHFRESKIDPFEEISQFVLNVRILPNYCYVATPPLIHSNYVYMVHIHSIKNGQDTSDSYMYVLCECITDECRRLIKSSMELEGKCYLCRQPLTAGNMRYNNWQAYENRRGYHLTC